MDGYTILETLAEGGMGRVLLARRDASGETCVLKELRDERARDPTARKRFEREAMICRELDHPNIARVLDAKLDGDKQWIAFEYVDGHSLWQLIHASNERSERVAENVAVLIALELLTALEYAHGKRDEHGELLNIVHRDLSPANVMISREGEVKIIDFGVARGNVGDFKTAAGMLVGTIRYMSPEQAAGEVIDHRSDLYTVAALLYELLAGRPLITSTDRVDALAAIAFAQPAVIDPPIRAELEQVIKTALAKDRARRYQSAKELREALERASGMPARAPQLAALIDRLFPARTAPETPGSLTTTVLRIVRAPIARIRRRPTWEQLLLVVLALVLSFSGVFAFIVVDRRPIVVLPAASPPPVEPEILPRKVIAQQPQEPPEIKTERPRVARAPVPAQKTPPPPNKDKHEPLRRMLLRLKASAEPEDDALLELHDALQTSIRAVKNPTLRRSLELKLAAFARGGGVEALERALDELERSAP